MPVSFFIFSFSHSLNLSFSQSLIFSISHFLNLSFSPEQPLLQERADAQDVRRDDTETYHQQGKQHRQRGVGDEVVAVELERMRD